MKVILSPSELIALVAAHFNLPFGDLTVEIGQDSDRFEKQHNQLLLAQYQDGNLDPSNPNGIRPDCKIAAIKLLRTFIPDCGLVNAKYAIEDWRNFLAYVKANGFPKMDSNEAVAWKKKDLTPAL